MKPKPYFISLALALMLLTGCVQYWVKPETSLQQTAADLHDCRLQANQGGEKVYGAMDMEAPCMTAKGYALSHTPPPSE